MKCLAYFVKSWQKKKKLQPSEAAAERCSLRSTFPYFKNITRNILPRKSLVKYLSSIYISAFQSWFSTFPPWFSTFPLWFSTFPSWFLPFPSWFPAFPPWLPAFPLWFPAFLLWFPAFPLWFPAFSPWSFAFPPWFHGFPSWFTAFPPWYPAFPPWFPAFPPWSIPAFTDRLFLQKMHSDYFCEVACKYWNIFTVNQSS